jgi:hypothetical protein
MTFARRLLKKTLLAAGAAGSKSVPVIVTGVPGIPLAGEKPVMVGTCDPQTT